MQYNVRIARLFWSAGFDDWKMKGSSEDRPSTLRNARYRVLHWEIN